MKVTKEDNLKQKFLKKLDEKYNVYSQRKGVHITDLTYCLLQSFYRKTNPKPHNIRTLQFFVDGARRHEALQELLGIESEVYVKKFGVVGSIDILLEFPVEIKTTRAQKNLPPHYFKQLGFYAVLCGVKEGYLIVQRINCKNNVPWEFYHIQWDNREIEDLERELRDKANLFANALKLNNANSLPKLDSSMQWKCRYCLYTKECSQG